jgi:hypothetical protein
MRFVNARLDAVLARQRNYGRSGFAVAHHLAQGEINALYFATHMMERPRGWDAPFPIGRYWRNALVVFFNHGVDTGTVWRSTLSHEPLLWRHVSWGRRSPDREVKEQSPWGVAVLPPREDL